MTKFPLEDVLLRFFREATEVLQGCDDEATLDEARLPRPLSHHRSRLLVLQKTCLYRIVQEYNDTHSMRSTSPVSIQSVQEALRELGTEDTSLLEQTGGGQLQVLQDAMRTLNDAARCALARFVLYDECVYEERGQESTDGGRSLETKAALSHSDLLEYAGLCNAAVRLPNVQLYLRDGSSLFKHMECFTRAISPRERLEHVQRLLMCAVGYDPDHGTRQVLAWSQTADREIRRTLDQLGSNMNVAVTNATLSSQQRLSDQEDGGVTRVVSVIYSEKVVDRESGNEISSTGAPKTEVIRQENDSIQRVQLEMARKAAALQQSLQEELLSMTSDERERQLQEAEQAHTDFLRCSSEIPSGRERMALLTEMDPQTQRLLAIRKVWSAVLEQNGGRSPSFGHNTESL